MCFDYDVYVYDFEQDHVATTAERRCCECNLPIRPGEHYQRSTGECEGEDFDVATCEVCAWFRERVAAAELEAGCGRHEAYPAFGGLYEALGEGHGEAIGLLDVNDYEERVER